MDATHSSPLHHHSSTLAKTLEYKLLAEILAALLRRGVPDAEVFRPDVDQAGWDVGLEALGVARHVQLKARVRGGKRGDIDLSLKLARKPSGCAIWFDYDPLTLALGPFRWFGNPPGQPLPALGETVTKHSKGNKDGDKTARPGHRVVRKGAFVKLITIEEVVDRLFGPAAAGASEGTLPATSDGGEPNASAREAAHRDLLVRHLRMRSREVPMDAPTSHGWLADLQEGRFESIPERLGPDEMLAFAHLMNGYELAQEAGLGHVQDVHAALTERAARTGTWTGTGLELWLVIFGEHRRARQDGHSGPDRDLLKGAYSALRARLRLTR
jgi:hypothetical protein